MISKMLVSGMADGENNSKNERIRSKMNVILHQVQQGKSDRKISSRILHIMAENPQLPLSLTFSLRSFVKCNYLLRILVVSFSFHPCESSTV